MDMDEDLLDDDGMEDMFGLDLGLGAVDPGLSRRLPFSRSRSGGTTQSSVGITDRFVGTTQS